ncbi:MAG: isochorismatase [Armatimonadota bacterium]
MLDLTLRTQVLERDENGYNQWRVVTRRESLAADETALLICDVWDGHRCKGAVERMEAMVPRMEQVVKAARAKSVLIVHSPSGMLDFYEGTPARQRALDAPRVEPPEPVEREDPPMPVDASDRGSDTDETETYRPRTRQHPGIEIQDEDVISDDGEEIYSFMQQQGIENLIIMGVHTNMCILNRSFGIKQMVRWGVNMMLVRDLTDAMYNPAMPPYVSHSEGTQLVIEYIEKFWCPSISSDDLLDGS